MFKITQGTVVFVLSITVLQCMWTLDNATSDYGKLFRIMYLYDTQACGYRLRKAKVVQNVKLSNETQGSNVVPIKWSLATVTVSSSLSARTRQHIELSISMHAGWMLSALVMWFFIRTEQIRVLQFFLTIFFYYSIYMVIFDISMAIVYVAHIQQSLTKGMILRYSGWSLELKLQNYDEFAGWIPILFCIFWMKGIVVLILNIDLLRIMRKIRRNIKKKEVRKRVMKGRYLPVPDPNPMLLHKDKTLYFRTGEKTPAFINSETF